MKNPFRSHILPRFPIISGIIGFLLRIWLFSSADAKGLLPSNHFANASLYVLSAIVMLVLFLSTRKLTPRRISKHSIRISSTYSYMLGGLGLALNAAYLLAHSTAKLTGLAVAASLVGTLIMVYMAFLCFAYKRIPYAFFVSVSIIIILQIIAQCQIWGTEPQLQKYFFPMMASIFLLLSAYYRTLLAARRPVAQRLAFFSQAAVYFCILSLNTPQWMFYCGMLFWAASQIYPCTYYKRKVSDMYLPQAVQYCIHALEAAGFEAYAVGGCVRDSLLGLTPADYDLCTNARPEETARVFSAHQLLYHGQKHGTIGVVLDGVVYEITTFRTEGGYDDARHPDWVNFVGTVEEDLARRDFTVNAMAYNPRTGYVDPFRGQADLASKLLRTVGDPRARFREDALRILRGARFSARFRLTPEPSTLAAMIDLAPLLDKIARERVFEELCKLLPSATAEDLLMFTPLLTQVIPELKRSVGFEQHSPHHRYDVFTHTAHVVEAVPKVPELRWAALLHDIGKPDAFTMDETGRGHFKGHAKFSQEQADRILLRLKAPSALRQQVTELIGLHMTPLEPDKKLLRRRLGKLGAERLEQLLLLQEADMGSKGTGKPENMEQFTVLREMIAEILQESACFSIKDLAVNGWDLQRIGIPAGPAIGKCLQWLLGQVQDEVLPNDRDALLQTVTKLLEDRE